MKNAKQAFQTVYSAARKAIAGRAVEVATGDNSARYVIVGAVAKEAERAAYAAAAQVAQRSYLSTVTAVMKTVGARYFPELPSLATRLDITRSEPDFD